MTGEQKGLVANRDPPVPIFIAYGAPRPCLQLTTMSSQPASVLVILATSSAAGIAGTGRRGVPGAG